MKASPLNVAQLSLVNSQLEVREEGFERPLDVIAGNKLYGQTKEGKGNNTFVVRIENKTG